MEIYNLEKITSKPYISFYSFIEVANHVLVNNEDTKHIKEHNNFNPDDVKEGDIILMNFGEFDNFLKNYYPKINNNFIFITGRCDNSVKNEHLEKINNKLIKWYGSNIVGNNEKFVKIPLGLQNLNWKFDNNPQSNINIIQNINNEEIERNGDILMSFSIKKNDKERNKCYNTFKNKSFVKQRWFGDNDRKNENFVVDYFRELKKHKFVLSPFGNGLDCHRTWETIYLGGVPIVKKHEFNDCFRDMPIWFVDKWEDVLECNDFEKKYNEIINNSNFEKCYLDYWLSKFFN